MLKIKISLTHTVRAYAKVNLHLEVLNKRRDSYHNIFSLNASLDLFDRLTFKELNVFDDKNKDILVDIHPEGGEYSDIITSIPAEDNLISKAIKTYLKQIGKSGKISVSVEKNIPGGAGLGGGSSDAAAVLKQLNYHFKGLNLDLQENELFLLGSKLGADVPYCLAGDFAFCEGIGDIIEKTGGKLDYWVLVAYSGIIINTAEAYRALKRNTLKINAEAEINKKKLLFSEGIRKGNINLFKNILKNDFEIPVFSNHPELQSIKNIIQEYDAEYVTMTGSGSCIIGIFNDKTEAAKAKEGLRNKAKAVIVKFL